MNKTKNILLVIAAVVLVGCLLYIPGLNKLGLYRDDWNNFYNLTVRGPETLIKAYESDRPADGYLITFLYRFCGTNIRGFFIWNLCCRILGAVFFALSMLIVWPHIPKMAGLAGIFAVAFPGFLQQVDGIAYVPHQAAMMCFMLSLLLTALACRSRGKIGYILFTFISILFSFASMMLMEYYVGMEIFRFGLIYLMDREHTDNGKLKSLGKSLLAYIPYLIPVGGFVVWRIFFFKAERAGADLIADQIQPLLAAPRDAGMKLLVRIVKNIWKLFIGVWTIPAYNLIMGLEKKPFLVALIPSLLIFAAGQIFLFLMNSKNTKGTADDAGSKTSQWLCYGLICGSVSILPLIIAGRDISFASSLDRFAWPGMIGSILFLIGMLFSMRNRVLRNLFTMAAILLAVFVQWRNQQIYIEQWEMTKDYLQQLLWRAPSIEKGTTVLSGGTLMVEEDYDVFGPIAMMYYPEDQKWAPADVELPSDVDLSKVSWTPIGAEVLNSGAVRDVILGDRSQREVRKIYVDKNYGKLLAITKPSAEGCLRVIDGENPIYSISDWTRIPEVGAHSRLSQIITDPDQAAALPFFMDKEGEHGWCYYFEKMELALQMDDPEEAAKLADAAFIMGLNPGDPVEWIPVAESYVQTGRMEDAKAAAENLSKDAIMERKACAYYMAKEGSGYEMIREMLCGWMESE